MIFSAYHLLSLFITCHSPVAAQYISFAIIAVHYISFTIVVHHLSFTIVVYHLSFTIDHRTTDMGAPGFFVNSLFLRGVEWGGRGEG